MKAITVIGAGKIGHTICDMLAHTGDYRITAIDTRADALSRLGAMPNVQPLNLDIGDAQALKQALDGQFAVLSAVPFHLTRQIAEAAVAAGAHYLDLTEDVAATRAVRRLAETAQSALIPQCGLAPGFVSVVAYDIARGFDTLDSVRMRVGALPQFPSNAINYNLTWSTEGVVNEYCEPCEAIVDGELHEVAALQGLEEFALNGITYEAFNTSGGLGSLCETLHGRVRELNYRTIRYPGHCQIMRALLNDLRLKERRHLLLDILENAIPSTDQDVVVIFVTVSGTKSGRLIQESYANHIRARDFRGHPASAIQLTTASGICTVLDLLANGQLPDKGLIHQEHISYADFISNRFGAIFKPHREALAA